MDAPRILVLHDQRGFLSDVVRICFRRRASFHLARSQSELMDLVSSKKHRIDLVIAKDVVRDDWFTAGSVLLGARAAGLRMPFILVSERSDRWTRQLVEVAAPGVVVDDRSSRWLVPLVLEEWLERVHRIRLLGTKSGVFRRGETVQPIRVRREHYRAIASRTDLSQDSLRTSLDRSTTLVFRPRIECDECIESETATTRWHEVRPSAMITPAPARI